jgi:hypothetical protein
MARLHAGSSLQRERLLRRQQLERARRDGGRRVERCRIQHGRILGRSDFVGRERLVRHGQLLGCRQHVQRRLLRDEQFLERWRRG